MSRIQVGDRVIIGPRVNDLPVGTPRSGKSGLSGIVTMTAIDDRPIQRMIDAYGEGPHIWCWVNVKHPHGKIACLETELIVREA